MLTGKVLERFSIGINIQCLLCILPNDWDSKHRVLKPTRWNLRRLVNFLFAHFTTGVCVFVGVAMCVDRYLHKPKFEQIIIDGIYFSVIFLVSVIALCCYYLDDQTVIVNNIMSVDKLLKEEMLTEAELKGLQDRSSRFTQILVVLEIFSFVGITGFGLIFFEEFDPFRRYVYTPLLNYFFFYLIPFHETLAFIAYIVYMRLVASYIISTLLIIVLYFESSTFWLEFLTDSSYQHSGSIEKLVKIYTIESVLCKVANNLEMLKISIPTLFFGAFFPIISLIYLSIKWYGVVNWGTYLSLPSCAILLLVLLNRLCAIVDNIHTLCQNFFRACVQRCGHVRTHTHTLPRKPKKKGRTWLSKYIQSCQPITFKILHLFHIRMGTFTTYFMQVIDKAIALLLS